MGRRPKNVDKTGRWSVRVGEHGARVRVREESPAGRVVLFWSDPTSRKRHQVYAETGTVRNAAGRIDAALEAALMREADDLAARLRIGRELAAVDTAHITLAQGFARYHDPRAGALPASRSARTHHRAARRFWCDRLRDVDGVLRADRPWNSILPSEVDAALRPLAARVPTAEKHVRCLRTVTRWLRDRAGFDGLKDPTRHVNLRKLREHHAPRRPRYTRTELRRLYEVAARVGPRFRFALIWAADSGARSAALYRAMRSDVDAALDVPPTPEQAPHGWALLPAMKGQGRVLTYLTVAQRAALDEALATYLAPLEARWLADGADYPLIPGGRIPRSGAFRGRVGSISNKAMEKWLRRAEKLAEVPHVARRGWHGIRRGWTDQTWDETESIDAVVAGGGWSDDEMVRGTYASRERLRLLARVRQAQEGNWG